MAPSVAAAPRTQKSSVATGGRASNNSSSAYSSMITSAANSSSRSSTPTGPTTSNSKRKGQQPSSPSIIPPPTSINTSSDGRTARSSAPPAIDKTQPPFIPLPPILSTPSAATAVPDRKPISTPPKQQNSQTSSTTRPRSALGTYRATVGDENSPPVTVENGRNRKTVKNNKKPTGTIKVTSVDTTPNTNYKKPVVASIDPPDPQRQKSKETSVKPSIDVVGAVTPTPTATAQPSGGGGGNGSAGKKRYDADRDRSEREREKADPRMIGNWRIGRTIGKGSSGRVKIAKNVVTGKYGAVKIVPRQALLNSRLDINVAIAKREKQLLGLEREIVIMKLIEHPNVLRLYDVWETRHELYLIMEYVEGGELFDYLVSRGRLPEDEALHYFQQLIGGVDYCHRFNICHRDLKPENLLLDKDRNIKIADFGMAALEKENKLLETSCGSPHYASPEIVCGRNYHGSSSDIWSCGIILFALLVGHLPFDGENVQQVLTKVRLGKFTMPNSLSDPAKHLIRRMLEVNPGRRATMDEIQSHLWFNRRTPIPLPLHIQPPNLRQMEYPVSSSADVDPDILANLQTLWYGAPESDLIEALVSTGKRWEKVFYYLLMKYRDRELEEFDEDDHEATQKTKAQAAIGTPPDKAPRRRSRESSGPRATSLEVRSAPPETTTFADAENRETPSKETTTTTEKSEFLTPERRRSTPPSLTTPATPKESPRASLESPVRIEQKKAGIPVLRDPVSSKVPTIQLHQATPERRIEIKERKISPMAPVVETSAGSRRASSGTTNTASIPSSPTPSSGFQINIPQVGDAAMQRFFKDIVDQLQNVSQRASSIGSSFNTDPTPLSSFESTRFDDAEDDASEVDPAITTAPSPMPDSDQHAFYRRVINRPPIALSKPPPLAHRGSARPAPPPAPRPSAEVINSAYHRAQVGAGQKPTMGLGIKSTVNHTDTYINNTQSRNPAPPSSLVPIRQSWTDDKENADVGTATGGRRPSVSGGRASFSQDKRPVLGLSNGNTVVDSDPTVQTEKSSYSSNEKEKEKGNSLVGGKLKRRKGSLVANEPPSPGLVPEGGRQSWFANLFNWKQLSYTLYSTKKVYPTRVECKKLLESFGVRVSMENLDATSSLKCRVEEIIDPLVGSILKPVRFRVEFSTLSGLSQTSLSNTETPEYNWMAATTMGGGQNLHTTSLTMVMEKGAHSAFRAIYNRLRRDWELDVPRCPPSAMGARYVPMSPEIEKPSLVL